MAQRCKRLHAKFNVLCALNSMIDQRDESAPAARKAKKAMTNNWTRRFERNAGQYFKQANNKPSVGFIIRGEACTT